MTERTTINIRGIIPVVLDKLNSWQSSHREHLLVARANNKQQIELKKLETCTKEKEKSKEIIDGYFRYAGAAVGQGTTDNLTQFGEYSHLVYFYLPPEYHERISRLNDCLLSTFKYDEALKLLEEIAVEYSAHLKDS